ncbi:hypothetical protein WN66_04413 [Saccharomyces cerevisiae]|nr:hypothetical protein WN66_04413 [Saccharomyces cerevisiae]
MLIGAPSNMRLRGALELLWRRLLHGLMQLRLVLKMHICSLLNHAIKRRAFSKTKGGKNALHGCLDTVINLQESILAGIRLVPVLPILLDYVLYNISLGVMTFADFLEVLLHFSALEGLCKGVFEADGLEAVH